MLAKTSVQKHENVTLNVVSEEIKLNVCIFIQKVILEKL